MVGREPVVEVQPVEQGQGRTDQDHGDDRDDDQPAQAVRVAGGRPRRSAWSAARTAAGPCPRPARSTPPPRSRRAGCRAWVAAADQPGRARRSPPPRPGGRPGPIPRNSPSKRCRASKRSTTRPTAPTATSARGGQDRAPPEVGLQVGRAVPAGVGDQEHRGQEGGRGHGQHAEQHRGRVEPGGDRVTGAVAHRDPAGRHAAERRGEEERREDRGDPEHRGVPAAAGELPGRLAEGEPGAAQHEPERRRGSRRPRPSTRPTRTPAGSRSRSRRTRRSARRCWPPRPAPSRSRPAPAGRAPRSSPPAVRSQKPAP